MTGAWHVIGSCNHRNVAQPIMNIIIGRALSDPGLNYAEYKGHQSYVLASSTKGSKQDEKGNESCL